MHKQGIIIWSTHELTYSYTWLNIFILLAQSVLREQTLRPTDGAATAWSLVQWFRDRVLPISEKKLCISVHRCLQIKFYTPSFGEWSTRVIRVQRLILETDVLMQQNHVSGTTYLPVCEIRIQEITENIHVSNGLQRIVTFLIIAPYKYSYLLSGPRWCPQINRQQQRSITSDHSDSHDTSPSLYS